MATPLADRPVHTLQFRKRRGLNWFTLGLTYATMYMGRYNLSIANKSLSDQYGWNKTQIGTIISFALLCYGLSEMFVGPICDRIGGRKAMIIGIFGAAFFNFIFGLGAYFGFMGKGLFMLYYFAVAWSLNMHLQSYCAVAIIKVNTGWFHVRERGVFSAIFGCIINGGRFITFFIIGIVIVALPWQWSFFIPSMVMLVMGLFTYKVVYDAPDQVGLPHFDTQDATSTDTEQVGFTYLVRKIFTNPIMITIAAAEFCLGIVRHGFEQWFPRYMQEAQGLKLDGAAFQQSGLIIIAAGIAGAFAAGTVSDWLFHSRRGPVAFIGFVLQFICLGVIWIAPNFFWISCAFVVNSFGITVVHSMLSGTASMDFGGKKASATAGGMFDGVQYLAGPAVGFGMGWMLERFGWGAWSPSMIAFPVIGAILMFSIWNTVPKRAAVPAETPKP